MIRHLLRTGALLTATALLAVPAFAQNQLNVICPVQAEWCSAAAVAFEKETGIKVAMTLKGSECGTSAERKRLLERWDKEVGSIAK